MFDSPVGFQKITSGFVFPAGVLNNRATVCDQNARDACNVSSMPRVFDTVEAFDTECLDLSQTPLVVERVIENP